MLVKLIRSTEISGGYWLTFWDQESDRKLSCEVGPEFGRRRSGGFFDLTEVEGVTHVSPHRRRSAPAAAPVKSGGGKRKHAGARTGEVAAVCEIADRC